ncbi:hypothetical protein CAPTEDRAFT_182288 [Capitella teleta]|uniref:RING-type domain-containing protein n=1 Tax=Capitella teleta TaxID=283909 RepID=R7TKP6_CAPTE|nr:hypothetical protein CAPTEDRAFT_182288 [Capitella teleta]|eukprot:ELT94077.1 hypothetical protein CAPTEDRAFT_182288 [Capitella teleta]
MEMLKSHSLLVVKNSDCTEYEGLLSVLGQHFHVRIVLNAPGELKGALIESEWRMRHLLDGYRAIIHQRFEQCESVGSFLLELQHILESQLDTKVKKSCQPGSALPKYYEGLLSDLNDLGWERVTAIDPSFSRLTLEAEDEAQRKHCIKLEIPQNYPDVVPTFTHEMPCDFSLHWTPSSCLADIFHQFRNQLALFQEFWDAMDEIDSKVWVLEPEQPTRSCCARRIALGQSASLQMEVLPLHPKHLPSCLFLGADHVTDPLRENFNQNIQRWDHTQSLLSNLETILQMTFPSPCTTSKEDVTVSCGICYAYRLEDQLPDQQCEDKRCAQPFHASCLYEWLRSMPDHRQSFNIIFGQCPYCSQPITVKMPPR